MHWDYICPPSFFNRSCPISHSALKGIPFSVELDICITEGFPYNFISTLWINWNIGFQQDLSNPSVSRTIVLFGQNKRQMEKLDTRILLKHQERKIRLLLCCRLIRGDAACWQRTISEFKSKLFWKKQGIPSGNRAVICFSSWPLQQAAGWDESLNLSGCEQRWQKA